MRKMRQEASQAMLHSRKHNDDDVMSMEEWRKSVVVLQKVTELNSLHITKLWLEQCSDKSISKIHLKKCTYWFQYGP